MDEPTTADDDAAEQAELAEDPVAQTYDLERPGLTIEELVAVLI